MADATIRDKAAIVGIGQTRFSKGLGLSEYEMAVEAIFNACDDAGISPRAIDAIVRYDMEQIDEEQLLSVLGNPQLRFFAGTGWGGGGSASPFQPRSPSWPAARPCTSSLRTRPARRTGLRGPSSGRG